MVRCRCAAEKAIEGVGIVHVELSGEVRCIFTPMQSVVYPPREGTLCDETVPFEEG
jgi:hypothetical protein